MTLELQGYFLWTGEASSRPVQESAMINRCVIDSSAAAVTPGSDHSPSGALESRLCVWLKKSEADFCGRSVDVGCLMVQTLAKKMTVADNGLNVCL